MKVLALIALAGVVEALSGHRGGNYPSAPGYDRRGAGYGPGYGYAPARASYGRGHPAPRSYDRGYNRGRVGRGYNSGPVGRGYEGPRGYGGPRG